MKAQFTVLALSAVFLSSCARPEDNSFAAQAVRRGDDCEAIAAGSAMDAYGHSVGPATQIYQDAYQNCMAWQQKKKENNQ